MLSKQCTVLRSIDGVDYLWTQLDSVFSGWVEELPSVRKNPAT
jgi:hypothetical protein